MSESEGIQIIDFKTVEPERVAPDSSEYGIQFLPSDPPDLRYPNWEEIFRFEWERMPKRFADLPTPHVRDDCIAVDSSINDLPYLYELIKTCVDTTNQKCLAKLEEDEDKAAKAEERRRQLEEQRPRDMQTLKGLQQKWFGDQSG